MHFHQNHCWCNRSHWDGNIFDCQYMVSIDMHPMGKYSGPEEEDFHNLLHEDKKMVERDVLDEVMMIPKYTLTLNQDVMDWLEKNVEDMKGHDYNSDDRKGWCIGDDEYRSHDNHGLTIFFRRRSDAMKFIKTWSTHKKPTTYLNYFKDDRRKLVGGKLVEWGHDDDKKEEQIEFEE